MIVSIKLDVDPIKSGYKDSDELKDNIIDFAYNLIINGAEELEAQLTVKEVEYDISVLDKVKGIAKEVKIPKEKWASKRYIESYADHKNFKNNILLTNEAMLNLDGTAPVNKNVIVIGGAASGKTKCYVEPNLMQMNSSYVVTCNPSDKIFEKYREIFSVSGYTLNSFNPHSPEKSMHYNPFEYIRKDNFEKDIGLMVDTLIANTSSPYQDPYWSQMDKVLLKSCIAMIIVRCNENEKNFSSLLEMLEIELDIEGAIEPLFIAAENLLNNDFSPIAIPNGEYIKIKDTEGSLTNYEAAIYKYALKHYEVYKNTPDKTKKTIVLSCTARLNSFLNNKTLELTAYDEMELDKIDDKKSIVFITFDFPGNEVLSAMMYAQIFNILSAKSEKTGALNRHVQILMDEFAETGYIPNFHSFVVTSRGRNISISICLSFICQLKLLYNDDVESIINCFDTTLLLGGIRDKASADSAAKKIGISKKLSYELKRIPEDQCILIFRGQKAFISEKYDITKHPNYKKLHGKTNT